MFFNRKLFSKFYPKLLKLLRRAHMYTGLVLLPWIILFGITGVFFNHPTWFSRQQVIYSTDSHNVEKITGFKPPDPKKIASQIVDELNIKKADSSENFTLDNSMSPMVSGRLGFFLDNEEAQYFLYLDTVNGISKIESRSKFPEVEAPNIDGQVIDLLDQNSTELEAGVAELFNNAGIESDSKPRMFRSQPKVIFNVIDTNGTSFNIGYNIVSGKLSVRQTDKPPPMEMRSILTRLHRLHRYPDEVNVRWVWSFFVDATGLMLIFWGVSGIIMWWQIKPTRVVGVIGISVALIIAFLVGTGTVNLVWF